MLHFLHNFEPTPIIFSLGKFSIHWYSLFIFLGGLVAFLIVLQLAKVNKIQATIVYDLLFYWLLGGILGARIYYVIYAWEFYQDSWLDIFKIWQGGLAIHGVIIGGLLATFVYCYFKKLSFWLIADLAVPGLIAGQAIGRWGNYFNQELFGTPTELPWGIPIDIINRPVDYLQFAYYHPTFLYESLGNLLILGVLLFLHFVFLKKKFKPGNVLLIYLALYSILRFLMEFLRTDYSPLVFGLRWAQLFSLVLILISLGWLGWRMFSKRSQNKIKMV